MKRYINIIAIDNNSIELHNKLKELGYKPLSWTTSTGKSNLRTLLTNSYPYDIDIYYKRFMEWVDKNEDEEITKKLNEIWKQEK